MRNAKAAVEEGVVAGGGVALLQAGKNAFKKLELTGDEATGAQIVRRALEEPLKQIAINAGLEGGVVAEKVRGLKDGHGLDAADRRVRRHVQGRDHRPSEGDAFCPAERCVHRGAVPHHRGSDRGEAGEGEGSGCSRWR